MSTDYASNTTTQDVTLWVNAATGSDSNSGIQASPLKTIAAAARKIPLIVRHNVIINVATGIYQESLDLLFSCVGIGNIRFVGLDWSNFTPTTGIQSGTFDINFGVQAIPNTATCASGGWTANELKGKFIRITSGTYRDEYLPIASNTATSVDFGMPADRTDQYAHGKDLRGQSFAIVEHAVILSQQGVFGYLINVIGTTAPIIQLDNENSYTWLPIGVLFENFQFSLGSATRALGCGSGGVLQLMSCKLNFTANPGNSVYGFYGFSSGAAFRAVDCYWAMSSNTNYGISATELGVRIILYDCVMDNGGRAAVVSGGQLRISGLYQNQQQVGVSCVNSATVYCFANIVFRNEPSGLWLFESSRASIQPVAGCGFIKDLASSGIQINRSTASGGSSNIVQLNNLVIDNCVTGVEIEGMHNHVDLQNCTLINNSVYGVNMAASKYAGFNSVATNNLTVMNNNGADFTLDGVTATSLADLRADSDKDISNSVRFNRLCEP